MLIRTATQDDHDAVLDLMVHLNPDDPELSASTSHSVFSQILDSDSFTITVAVQDDSIVGTCYLNVIPNLTRRAAPYAVIENVVTHPDFRRRGIGKALITNALEDAKNQGCYKVMLLTGRDQKVQEFYTSCGMNSGTKTAFIMRFDNL